MLQDASIMPGTKSKKEVRALGAMERLFWLMDQKHPAHLTVTAEVTKTRVPRTHARPWQTAGFTLIRSRQFCIGSF